MEKNSKWILGVRVDDFSDEELRNLFAAWVREHVFRSIVTPNPEFVLLAQNSNEYKAILTSADLSLADGVGLQFASVALGGERIINRQTGVDTIHELLGALNEVGGRALLVGDDMHGTYGVGALTRAREVLSARYGRVQFDALDPGVMQKGVYLADLGEHEVYNAIFVALPMATQLVAVKAYKELGYHGIVMGIGGTLDAIAGTVRRAPEGMRRLGFEWLWRFWREPSRYKRMYRAIIVFPCKIAYTAWEQGQLFAATKRVFSYLLKGNYVRN